MPKLEMKLFCFLHNNEGFLSASKLPCNLTLAMCSLLPRTSCKMRIDKVGPNMENKSMWRQSTLTCSAKQQAHSACAMTTQSDYCDTLPCSRSVHCLSKLKSSTSYRKSDDVQQYNAAGGSLLRLQLYKCHVRHGSWHGVLPIL